SDGILLLHDIAPVFDTNLIRKLNYLVDYDRPEKCLFMGYWMTSPFVQPPANIAVSFYQNPDLKTGVMVFFNTGKKDSYLGGTAFSPAGVVLCTSGVPAEGEKPVRVKRIYDPETDQPVKVSFRNGLLVIDEPFICESHTFRLLAVELQ
ncbi:MAG: hypothetical protein NC823_02965, partial [Candidatus Omnitrophica bacterium]|nr:hypothetical protein [Candidatus Omnitrophota bacterium]